VKFFSTTDISNNSQGSRPRKTGGKISKPTEIPLVLPRPAFTAIYESSKGIIPWPDGRRTALIVGFESGDSQILKKKSKRGATVFGKGWLAPSLEGNLPPK